MSEINTVKHGNAVAALVLSIVGIVLSITGIGAIVGLVCAIVGLCLGKSAKKAGNTEGIASAGVIMGWVTIGVAIIAIIIGCLTVGMLSAVFATM